jgi:GrpB-like predicted nucleotidyltransferase (UPF0157 family)
MRRGATDMNCGTNEIERGLRRASLVLVDHLLVELVDVTEVRAAAEAAVEAFRRDFASELGEAEVHHIGATSLPFGHTKGDVDVNVRVADREFSGLVAGLDERLERAQEDNWTPTFASFSTDAYELPLGVQVTVLRSTDDFLLALRDRMRADPELLRRYDELKLAAAAGETGGYWKAKAAFFDSIL